MRTRWLGMMYIAASPVAITVRYTGKEASNESIEACTQPLANYFLL
jgi:hypothetical protein